MNKRLFIGIFTVSLVALVFGGPAARGATSSKASSGGDQLVYFGTYNGPKSKGIYAYRLDPVTAAMTPLGLAAESANPTFLAVHPNKRFLYAANEIGNFGGKGGGAASAYALDRDTGRLTLLNQVSTVGSGPCHLVVDKTGQCVVVANYGGGSTVALPIQKDGRLGESSAFIQHQGSSVNRSRQEGPHAHGAAFDPANRFAFVADLGLDKVLAFRFDPAKGSLVANDPAFGAVKPGAGPRHFAFHPSGRYAYAINELDSTMTVFTYDAKRGALEPVQSLSTLPENFKGVNYPAEVAVHPSGKFVYGSNRGHDSIVVFAVASGKGTLTPVQHEATQGKWPRSFGIDPTGRFFLAANQNSDTVVVFRIDPGTGRLAAAGQTLEVGAPVTVAFVGPGK